MTPVNALHKIAVVLFAGFGGTCKGYKDATGRSPEVAINHDKVALAMHKKNNPETQHWPEDVWKATPAKVLRGRRVGFLWASPDCKHFSRAKGSKPVEKKIRSLAWVVVKWTFEAQPDVICLENVREFQDWGPVVPMWQCACGWKGTEGQAKLERARRACPRCDSKTIVRARNKKGQLLDMPDPKRKGITFKRFVGRYFGKGIGQELTEPLPAALSKDHVGLVFVWVSGEPYVIVDIGMRMLRPRELARGQGFPDSWKLIGTQSKQVACIGNSVPPPVAAAVVRVNYQPQGATA